MLRELIKEVVVLQDKERFLEKLLPQCISLIGAYTEKSKSKTKIYIARIDNLIHEYNLCFINEEEK
jgi:hypothetical protein